MKTLTPQEAREKIEKYCAYQERSHREVRNKLYTYGLYRSEVDEILSDLIGNGFLNEERFAKAFAGGKFRMKRWGRIKITQALEAKGVSPNCIRIALKEIDDDAYIDTLRTLIDNKLRTIEAENVYVTRDKLSKYAMQKGYEADLVWREIHALMP